MKLFKSLAALALSLAMLIPGISNAAISYPALEVKNLGSEDGLLLTSTGLTIDATVTGILDDINTFTDIDHLTFSLTATGTYSLFTHPDVPGTLVDGSYDGSFDIGDGLLTGTFVGLSLSGLSSQPTLAGALNYTGGTMAGDLAGGSLYLAIAGNNVQGKLGAVVTVPAAAWLFGSGLLGLVGITRRKTA
jgi:hypothetical protein